MKSLGIDIGTTTISAAVLEDGCFITSETCKNNSFLADAARRAHTGRTAHS